MTITFANFDIYLSRKSRPESDTESGISGCTLSLPTLNITAGPLNYNTIKCLLLLTHYNRVQLLLHY